MNIKRALLSVSNKNGIVSFAKSLHELGIEIISTGGTMKTLKEAGIPVRYVSEITNFPEIMDGRVKTLNPYIHGGILALRDNEAHVKQMHELGIEGIDLVVVNLYPFKETVTKPNVELAEAIENIDIGGPAMIRAAAKNFEHVAVIVNPAFYEEVLSQLKTTQGLTKNLKMKLAKEAYAHTAAYDTLISKYLTQKLGEEANFEPNLTMTFEKIADLRYGENPHQKAALYKDILARGGIANCKQLHGKELSYNNIVDMEAAFNIVKEFKEPAATIIKHTNPCGTAVDETLLKAYQKAYEADEVSAFGGIVAFNREVDQDVAKELAKLFLEVIIAPAYSKEALENLMAKKNLRIVIAEVEKANSDFEVKRISGGLLVQDSDKASKEISYTTVTKREPTKEELKDLLFAFKVVKHVKSNAIVVAKAGQTVGVGAGQMNRVGSAKIALEQNEAKNKGAVLASDAFFPFGDTVELANTKGITAIIQPGGSVRDEESIELANKYNIAMIFTGVRHFKH